MNTQVHTSGSPSGLWQRAKKPLFMAVLLIVAWLLWSGFLKPLLVGLGIFSTGLTLWVVKRMGYFDNELFAFRYGARLLPFWAWLGGEMLRSSIEVARIVISPTMRIDPQVVEVPIKDFGLVDQALLGNSITLTPGTLTLDVHDDRLLVHVLTKAGSDELLGGEMSRRVAALKQG